MLPFWNRDIFFLQYLYYTTVDFKLVRQFWQNMFIFETSAIWVHTTCLFLCSVHFLSPLVISGHALIQNRYMVTYRNAFDTQICVWAELPTQICTSYAFHDMCLALPMKKVLLNSTIIKIERSFVNGDAIGQPNKVTNVPDWIMSIIDWCDPENGQQGFRHWRRLVLYVSLKGTKMTQVADFKTVWTGR